MPCIENMCGAFVRRHPHSRGIKVVAMKLINCPNGIVYVAAGSSVIKLSQTGEGLLTFRCDKCTDSQVVSMSVHSDGTQLFVGYTNKVVACFDTTTSLCTANATLRKQPTAILHGRFSLKCLDRSADPDLIRDVVLASDKAGEVFALDAPALRKQALVAGHTASVITDMAIHTTSGGKQLVATSDRDEKVRISHFPDMENISTFCLAHTNVVASICFVELNGQTLLLSTGWDHQLILWNANTGRALKTVSFLSSSSGAGMGGTSSTVAGEEVADAKQEEMNEEEQGEEGGEQGDGGEGEGGDGEDLEGKVYDELSAGNYPFKVITNVNATNSGSVTVTVLFKGSALMKVLTLSALADGAFALSEAVSVPLATAPLDAAFTAVDEVCVVQPLPQGLQVFQVGNLNVVQELTGARPWAGQLVSAAQAAGMDFAPLDANTDGNPATGMKKHTLDRRFNSSENLQLRTGRGAKRSKRANRGQKEV